jgi:hypothetical protein
LLLLLLLLLLFLLLLLLLLFFMLLLIMMLLLLLLLSSSPSSSSLWWLLLLLLLLLLFSGGRYIEHVKEELDAPREFYFDAAAQRLYFFHNATAGTPPPANWTFEAPLLAVLFNVSGTPEEPVVGVTFDGLTVTGAAASYVLVLFWVVF